jgi:hypothetical protein
LRANVQAALEDTRVVTGPATVPFGDRLAAIPLQALWAGT